MIDGELILTQEYFSNKIIYNFLSNADGPHEIEIIAITIDSLEGRGFKTLEVDNNYDYLNLIFDNLSENFSAFGGWLSSFQPDRYGPNYYVLPPNSTGLAKWRVNLPENTKVKINAMWSEHANRSSQARYVIKTNLSDSTLIVMNQRIKGGKWNYLTETNTINNSSVEIITSSDGYVIADAIRFYRNYLSSVSSPEKNISEFYLYQDYPNPFNLKTKVAFFLFKKTEVKFLNNKVGQKIY